MCEEPMATEQKISELADCVRALNPSARIVKTVFRPKPLEDIRDEKVLLTTTAPTIMGETIRHYIEQKFGCDVVAVSHHLSNRPKLRADIAGAIKDCRPSVLLTELKAAAIDVATALGIEAGLRVVYADNIPVNIESKSRLTEEVIRFAECAVERFTLRKHHEKNP
jgi:cyclic 2,3-diphosphoglycerate synthetase